MVTSRVQSIDMVTERFRVHALIRVSLQSWRFLAGNIVVLLVALSFCLCSGLSILKVR